MSEQTTELSDAKRAALSEMIDSYALAFHAAIVRPESHKKMKAKAESIMDAILDRALAAPTAPAPTEPVAWMDDFGNVFPLAANKGAGSWLDDHKRNWKPLYATPPSAVEAAQPEAVGEVLFDEAFGCKAGQLYVNLPVGTKLYTAIAPAQRVASEREAFEAKLKEQWPHADYAFDGAEYESAAVQCAWAAWMWRAAAPTTEATSSSDAERLDAARYRWLRDFYSPPDDEPWDNIDCAFVRGGEELDAAIDAAIATKGGKL